MTRADCESLAERLFVELGVNDGSLPWRKGWHFGFDSSTRRFGLCDYQSKTISLSWKLVSLNDEREVSKTIRHEIAHALVGPGHGHNSVWRAMDVRCGGDGRRCYSSENVATPDARWEATCFSCGQTAKRHKAPRRGKYVSCGKCSKGRFNPNFLMIFLTREEKKLTKSFIQILARHDGPYRLQAVLPDEKGPKGSMRPQTVWMPDRTSDPVEAAMKLMAESSGSIVTVHAWSDSEQQFVLTVKERDRAMWEAERTGWREAARTIQKETSAVIALTRPPAKAPDGLTQEIIDRVHYMRSVLGENGRPTPYMAIELMILGETKKGFWAMNVLKTTKPKNTGAK